MAAQVQAYHAWWAPSALKTVYPNHNLTLCPLVTQAYFAKWGDEGEVDLSKAFAELIILTASRTLMGAGRALPHP